MQATSVQVFDPLTRRLTAYIAERFPLVSTTLVVIALFAAGVFSVPLLLGRDGSLTLSIREVAGAAALVLIFFHLRLFDEFKDHLRDQHAHPERLLSRGVVTVEILRNVSLIVVALELGLNLWIGGHPLRWYIAILLYSLLMRYEFFAAAWLTRRPLLYALTHMAITPLLALYVCSFVDATAPFQPASWLFVGVAASGAIAYELARKTWAPEQEHQYADSYSKLWGPRRATLASALASLVCGAVTATLSIYAALHWSVPALVIMSTGLALAAALRFARQPTVRGSKLLADSTSLLLLVSLVAVAVGSAGQNPLQWSWSL